MNINVWNIAVAIVWCSTLQAMEEVKTEKEIPAMPEEHIDERQSISKIARVSLQPPYDSLRNLSAECSSSTQAQYIVIRRVTSIPSYDEDLKK